MQSFSMKLTLKQKYIKFQLLILVSCFLAKKIMFAFVIFTICKGKKIKMKSRERKKILTRKVIINNLTFLVEVTKELS